jgi:hypothetical protein
VRPKCLLICVIDGSIRDPTYRSNLEEALELIERGKKKKK